MSEQHNYAPLNAEWFKRTYKRIEKLEQVAKAAREMVEQARKVERGELGGTHALASVTEALDAALAEMEKE